MTNAERSKIFEDWIDAHRGILFKVARAYGSTHSDREDLFQEVALQVWHSADTFRGDCKAATWIYRVALNTALSWDQRERKHSIDRRDFDEATALLVVPEVSDPSTKSESLAPTIF